MSSERGEERLLHCAAVPPEPEPQPADIARAAALQQRLVQETHGCLLTELEVLLVAHTAQPLASTCGSTCGLYFPWHSCKCGEHVQSVLPAQGAACACRVCTSSWPALRTRPGAQQTVTQWWVRCGAACVRLGCCHLQREKLPQSVSRHDAAGFVTGCQQVVALIMTVDTVGGLTGLGFVRPKLCGKVTFPGMQICGTQTFQSISSTLHQIQGAVSGQRACSGMRES